MKRRLGLAVLMWSLLISSSAGSNETPQTSMSLDALMLLLQQSGGVRADFVETRMISILAAPIESRGTLYFAPPDRIARVTTQPGHSTAVVRGMRADVIDETGRRSVDLRSSDIAYTLISNIMVLLRGDLPGLRERYELSFDADGQAWELDLDPRAADLRAIIVRIRVKGVGATVTEMDTLETNGDATHSKFSNVETGLDFDADGSSGVFSIDPPQKPNE